MGRSRAVETARDALWWGLYYSREVTSPHHSRPLADQTGAGTSVFHCVWVYALPVTLVLRL